MAKRKAQVKKSKPKQPRKKALGCALSQERFSQILRNKNAAAHFHKGLCHDENGKVDPVAFFEEFIPALQHLDRTRTTGKLDRIPWPGGHRPWVNPVSGWALDTEASDPCYHVIPDPPALDSKEAAAEMVELYWMALLRDLPFSHWKHDANIAEAARELSRQPLFIKRSGDVNKPPEGNNGYDCLPINADNIFRGGELFAQDRLRERCGPYISQFLWQEIPYGTLRIPQRMIWAQAHTDYMTDVDEWLAVQNGEVRDPMQNLVGEDGCANERRFISTMRDLATYVHFDQLYEAYLNAALILLGNGYELDSGNPYSGIANQEGFGTLGGPHILSLVTEAATRALKEVWRQKWTHLRLRPEVYGGLLELCPDVIPDGSSLLKKSKALKRSRSMLGNALLPMAFPEGSPMHPAYGAGHATVAGACVTILKAFFNEDQPVRDLVESSADGEHLLEYTGKDAGHMTVGLELDKLAANISIGRNMAGVHWRSDYTQSVLLGQRVAIDILFRQCRDYIEDYSFNLTTFGGGKARVNANGVEYCPVHGSWKTILGGSSYGLPDRIQRDRDEEIAKKLLAIV